MFSLLPASSVSNVDLGIIVEVEAESLTGLASKERGEVEVSRADEIVARGLPASLEEIVGFNDKFRTAIGKLSDDIE